MYQYLGQVLRNDELRIPPRKSPSIYPSGKRWVVPSAFTGSNHPAWGVNRKLFTTTEKSREGDEFRSVAFLTWCLSLTAQEASEHSLLHSLRSGLKPVTQWPEARANLF